MKWLNFVPPKDLLKRIEGVDEGLRKNKRIGRIGRIGFIISLAPILFEVIRWWDQIPWENLASVSWAKFLDPSWVQQNLTLGYIILIALLLLTTFAVLIIWNRFWLRESNAPFRYTFSVDDFKPVLGETGDADKNIVLLSHHLCGKINERIGRLLLLDEKELTKEDGESASRQDGFLQSHIHISGFYTKRKDRHGQWLLEIMPRVRIGPPGSPETLAYPILYPLKTDAAGQNAAGPPILPLNSDTEKYEQILERLYFTVATEVYNQIKRNVQEKISLLPSDYFRAVALLYEAEDYARSNTLEAYDEARKLYQEAVYYFDPTLRPLSKYRGRKIFQQAWRVCLRFLRGLRHFTALIFPRLGQREVLLARSELGYVRMLLFRRILGGLLGQKLYPVFETRPVAERALFRLQRLSDELPAKKTYFFEAFVTTALSWFYVGSILNARDCLKKAEGLDPNRAGENALYNFTLGEIEAHLRTELKVFQRVVDLEPRFEVAQFSLAIKAEKLWRTRPSLERNVAEWVLKKYEEVLKLNPGNVGAWANRGYVCWLLGGAGDLQEARENFLSGREYKDIKRETVVAELDHGLARIYAEEGNFVSAYEHYTSATSAIVTQAITNYVEYYFDLIGEPLFRRYERYRKTVENHCQTWEALDEPQEEFKQLLNSFRTAESEGKAALKKLRTFVNAICREISTVEENDLKEWILAKIAEKPAFYEKTSGQIPPQQFFCHLQDKLADDLTGWEIQTLKGIVLDPFFIAWMEKRLKSKANRRVRQSILAFACNDYGDACFFYFLRDGDERYFNKARDAYLQATQLNPSYAISFYNLYRLHNWKWEFENARASLLEVKALEPNWPDGKLALAEINSRLTERKQKEAEKERKAISEIAATAGNKEQELQNLREEAAQLREKITRGAAQKAYTFTARAMASSTGAPVTMQTGSAAASPMSSASPVSGQQVASNIAAFEETRTKNLEEKIDACKKELRALEEKKKDHHSRADKYARESEDLAREALDILQSLLPHRSFWIKRNGGKQFNLNALSSKNPIPWEREFYDLHVHTLSYLANIFLSRKKEADAWLIHSHVQKRFWPASVFPLRNILKNNLENTLFDDALYSQLIETPAYCQLLSNEEHLQLLRQNRRLKLYIRSREYRELTGNASFKKILKNPRHRDWLDYLEFNRIIFATGENWGLEYFYFYRDLEYVFYDPAFDANQKGPLPYQGIQLKERKDFFIEAARQPNRSPYFYYWVGDRLSALSEKLTPEKEGLKTAPESENGEAAQLEEAAKELRNEALKAWEKACASGEDPHVMVRAAENLKSLQLWQQSLELYRRAMKTDKGYRELSKSVYHLRCGSLLWILGQYEKALGEFDHIRPNKTDAESPQISKIADEILSQIKNAADFYRFKNWLISREREFARKNTPAWKKDARAARIRLVRDKYRQIQPGQDTSASMLPVVTPVAIEVDAGLFSAAGTAFSDDHPLVKTHYPAAQKRIEERLGVSVFRLRVRLNNSGMGANTYVIMIMEVPIVMGTAEPGKRFLPDYRKYSAELTRLQISVQAAYNPMSGELNGAWISESDLQKIPAAYPEAWDTFEYMARHLQAVITEHIGAFLDLQKTDDLLAKWQEAGGDQEPERKALARENLPDLAAKNRLTEALHWLLKERVPVLNLPLILKTFGEHYSPEKDIISVVEALRLALREELPGNRPDQRFLELSPEFEAEIQRHIHKEDGKLFFAIEPQITQDLLTAFREAMQPQEQWKTVVVTRQEGIRFFVRRLIEIEFPRVKILSFRELKPELRKQVSGSVVYKA